MKNLFQYKKTLIISGLIMIILITSLVLRDGNSKQSVVAVRGDVVQEIIVTGKVKANQSVSLGFDKSGKIQNVYVSVGQEIKQGETLVSLETGEALADLSKAKAVLEEEKIKLREIKNTAPASYEDAAKNLETAIREGFSDADNAVRNRVDQFFKNVPDSPRFEISINSGSYTHYFTVPSDTAVVINSERKNVEEVLKIWKSRLVKLKTEDLEIEADRNITDLKIILSFLDRVAGAVNTFTSADYDYDATVSGYKTVISSARSEVVGAISDLVTAKDKFNSAPILGVGGQFESVLAQEAKVVGAEAAVSALESSLSKSFIKAPFDGVVTIQDAKIGSAVSPGETLISIISRGDMYVEANVSEIHIGKVNVGNPVMIEFDAFPNEVFTGSVAFVEPGEVLIDGIVNYKIRVNLDNFEEKIKSGLTANLKIQTAKRVDVITLPLYVIIKENNQNFVNKVIDGKVQKTPVVLGLSSNDGYVEILQGIAVGETIQF